MIGVNLAGAEFGSGNRYGTDYIYPNASELDYYAGKGVGLVRLPVTWERLQPVLGGPLNAAEVGRLSAFLAQAGQRGVQVIVDLHNFGRHGGEPIGSAAVPVAAFADLWGRLATAIKDQPALRGYGLMNEPHGLGDPARWPAAAQAAVDAIRTVDARHQVIVAGDNYGTARSWIDDNANLNVRDSANNLVYEAHQYFDGTGVHAAGFEAIGVTPTSGAALLQPFLDWLDARGAKGFIGEFAVPGDDPRWLPVLDEFLTVMERNGLDGAYWAGGPWWGADRLAIEPVNGVDRPQMGVLTRHTNVAVAPLALEGGAGADVLHGGRLADRLSGGAGDDMLRGYAGNDVLLGGAGDDRLYGDGGDDQLFGGDGQDLLFGGAGSDLLAGGGGNDRLVGDAGDDVMGGEDGDDLLEGGAGNDKLYGDAGNDRLYGGDGADELRGGAGADELYGEAGDDRLYGGEGADRLFGNDGADELRGEAGDDALSGGAGNDLVAGGAGNDQLYGDAGDDVMGGEDGDDLLAGGDGNDQLYGDAGDDVMGGMAGDDLVAGGDGNDRLYGDAGNDVIGGGAGNDRLDGGSGDDQLWGDGGADVFAFASGSGRDRIMDFRPSEGDRVLLDDGQAWSIAAGAGGAMLTLSGGGTVQLVGFDAAQWAPNLVVR